jgi:hypothetical protein
MRPAPATHTHAHAPHKGKTLLAVEAHFDNGAERGECGPHDGIADVLGQAADVDGVRLHGLVLGRHLQRHRRCGADSGQRGRVQGGAADGKQLLLLLALLLRHLGRRPVHPQRAPGKRLACPPPVSTAAHTHTHQSGSSTHR